MLHNNNNFRLNDIGNLIIIRDHLNNNIETEDMFDVNLIINRSLFWMTENSIKYVFDIIKILCRSNKYVNNCLFNLCYNNMRYHKIYDDIFKGGIRRKLKIFVSILFSNR